MVVSHIIIFDGWFVLWCLTPLSTIFQWRSILLMEETGDSREITTMNMKEKIKIFY